MEKLSEPNERRALLKLRIRGEPRCTTQHFDHTWLPHIIRRIGLNHQNGAWVERPIVETERASFTEPFADGQDDIDGLRHRKQATPIHKVPKRLAIEEFDEEVRPDAGARHHD